MSNERGRKACGCAGGSCGGVSRRAVLAGAGAGATAALAGLPVMAGPFESNDYLRLIPVDKKLDPAWVRSLFARGEPEVVTDPAALRHIGMPVGGLFAGTVYLGGDGRLWLWDVFNRDQEAIAPRKVSYRGGGVNARSGLNYVEPAEPRSPFAQGFGLRLNGREVPLDASGFKRIAFRGEYPRARVTYDGGDLPVSVRLEAFSPFLPLSIDDSSLPVTILRYTVKNTGAQPVELELFGFLQNPVCLETKGGLSGTLRNRVVREAGLTAVECVAESGAAQPGTARPDVLFEDFEKPDYAGWTAEGTAFGSGPVRIQDIPEYQGDVGGVGERVVNSHASAPGASVGEKDGKTGTLTSRPFTVARRFIAFRIGGGAHKGKTCLNLLVDGKVVASATGRGHNRMQTAHFAVRAHEGKEARLQIVDHVAGGWGNIGVDQIVFTDTPPVAGALEEQRDFGTMVLAIPGGADGIRAAAARGAGDAAAEATAPLDAPPTGEIARRLRLAPGEEADVPFLVAWHFPNFYARGCGGRKVGHAYAARFPSALDVARHVAAHFDRLAGGTRRWVETWYDSTLPYWFLDRTMANTSTLATTTCYRFRDGRFWAWEGIGCCPGTCTHVWHYAQAPGRLFPSVERDLRERVDFGMAQHGDGGIGMRAWLDRSNEPAHDGQCGRILGAYREHQTSPDGGFLTRTWPRIRKAVEYLIGRDGDADGLIEGAQPNTLDAAWYGKISFLASLYLAALRAGQAMAEEMGDDAFAKRCADIAARGARSILELYNGEYFIQKEDPEHAKAIGVGNGCYIDQVFGQAWAHHVGLGRLFDAEKQRSALRALWKYSFVPDVGPFRDHFKRGRWYAVAGDAGLIMCSWPKGGRSPAWEKHWQYMYFNECMSGFEYQAASHMVWEGMLQEGLAVTRAIHDRYHAARRNPYNEIECSDHYARAMASYGVFLAACGFEYHGPKGHIGFAPRLTPERFKAAFVGAEGWGTFEQDVEKSSVRGRITVKNGTLRVKTVALGLAKDVKPTTVKVALNGKPVGAGLEVEPGKALVALEAEAVIVAGGSLDVSL